MPDVSLPAQNVREITNGKGDWLQVIPQGVEDWCVRLHRGNQRWGDTAVAEKLGEEELAKLVAEFVAGDYSGYTKEERPPKKGGLWNALGMAVSFLLVGLGLVVLSFLIAFFLKLLG